MIPSPSLSSRFERIVRVGDGIHGPIWKGKDVYSNDTVILKYYCFMNVPDGCELPPLPHSLTTEIMLSSLPSHPNIRQVIGWYRETMDIVVVGVWKDVSLSSLLRFLPRQICEGDLQSIVHGIANGLEHLHHHFITHCDLKPANILLSLDGNVCICDMGSAMFHNPQNFQGQEIKFVVSDRFPKGDGTRWYCAPEVLLSGDRYNPSRDMWSLGCIIAEILLREPLFPGHCDIEQLSLIHRKVDSLEVIAPSNEISLFFNEISSKKIVDVFSKKSILLQQLIQGMICVDSNTRFSVRTLLSTNFMTLFHCQCRRLNCGDVQSLVSECIKHQQLRNHWLFELKK